MKLSDIMHTLITVAKDDIAQKLNPALAAFFSSMAANPSTINLVASLAQLEVTALSLLPAIEQDEMKALAQLFAEASAAALIPKA